MTRLQELVEARVPDEVVDLVGEPAKEMNRRPPEDELVLQLTSLTVTGIGLSDSALLIRLDLMGTADLEIDPMNR